MKRILLLLLLFWAALAMPARATHYMGGEISWECLPNGNYRFVMKVYRECYFTGGGWSATYMNPETISGPFGDITVYLFPNALEGIKDISPVCHPGGALHYACELPVSAGMAPNLGAIQEWTYTSDQAHPSGVTLNGIPPASGWTFYWDGCCRNSASNYSGQPNWYIRARMYPYQGQNAYPCFDSSPRFLSRPLTSLPMGYPFSFNLLVNDPDLDSLSYALSPALIAANGNVPYNSPQYTATSPLPGPVYNPNNVPAALDPLTGELTFTSFTGGSYILALKTTSYRCGVLIAEVTREIQVSILPNALPDYPLTTMVPNYPPEIQFQGVGGGPAVTTLPVWAGDYLEFDLIAFDTLPPLLLAPAGVPNGMTLQAAGMDFGTGFSSDSSGCPYPPCATLDPSPDSINAMPNFLVLTTRFSWQTDCSHVGGNCGAPQSLHAFNFQLADVACPVPASSSHTFTVLVRNPILDPPQLHTLAALPGPGLKLAWSPPDTSQIPFYFYGYYIYHATSANGPFTLLDSLPSFMDTTYVVNITGTGDHGFMIRTRSGCDGQAYSSPSDTLWDFLVRRDEEVKDKDHAPAFLQVGPGGDLAFRVTEAGYYALELHTLQGQCLRRVPSRYYAEGDHRLDWVSGLPARAIYLATAISQGHAVHSKVLLR